ncbi:MAG: hypothetical protein WBH47_10675 [Streptosporangiaceae bacterium]
MAEAARRRGHNEDSIYFDASKNRWVGAASLGFTTDGERRIRPKVRGRTRAEIRDKLQALHRELEAGLRVSASYTVASCVRDWLDDGLTTQQPDGRLAARTSIGSAVSIAVHIPNAIGRPLCTTSR